MSGFSAEARSDEDEMMDASGVGYATLRGCLADLAQVNRLSFGYRPTLRFLDRLKRAGRLPRGRPLRLLDVGCGYGDTLREIARWGQRNGVAVELAGLDINPLATRAAAEATPAGAPIVYAASDVFEHRPEVAPDLIVSALFAHHLDDARLVRFLSWMEGAARLGWFVNDLHRRRLAYEGFRLASRALRMHPFVQHDGPVSFARSFVAKDWRRGLAAAGVPAAEAAIEPWTPFRLCVSRVRPA